MFFKYGIVVGVLGLVLAWILPGHYSPWVSAYQDFISMLSCLILFVSVLFRCGGRVPISAILFFVLSLVPVLQWLYGVVFYFSDAFVSSLYLIAFGLMIVAGYNIKLLSADGRFLFCCLLGGVIVGGVISVFLVLRQWLHFDPSLLESYIPIGQRPRANMGQPNNLATLLMMGLMAVWYLFETRILGRVAASLLASFILVGVALTLSRAPWVMGIAIALFWFWKAGFVNARLGFFWCSVWGVGYVLLLALLPFLYSFLMMGDVFGTGFSRGFESLRYDMWRQLLSAVFNGSFWGYGWGQVSVAQVSASFDIPVRGMTEHSHNILLDLMVWNGPFIGGAVVALLLFWLLRLGFFARSREGVFCLLLSGCVITHGMLEFPIEYAYFLIPLGLLLGCVCSEVNERSLFCLTGLQIISVFVAGVFFLAWIWGEYRLVEEDFRLARMEQARILGAKGDPNGPDVKLLTREKAYIHFVRQSPGRLVNDDELDEMKKVVYRHPIPFTLYRYALALGVNGFSKEAHQQLMLMKVLYGDAIYTQSIEDFIMMSESYPTLRAMF